MLRFSLGDIPVRVHFSFLLIALLAPSTRVLDVGAWILVAFLAILLHEMGHAVMARRYGARPVTVTLFALGGVTVYPVVSTLTPGRRFVISAMGSVVGIVTGGLVLLVWLAGAFDGTSQVVRVGAAGYIWAALGWGVLNWIPIRPLDGGAMMTSFLEIVVPSRAMMLSKVISVIFGIAAAAVLWMLDFTFGAFFVLLIMMVGLSSGSEDAAPQRPQAPPPAPRDDAIDEQPAQQRPDDPPFPI